MNKAKIEDGQTDKQLVALIATLLLTAKGQEFDGFTACRYLMDKYHIYTDHHITTEVMDILTRGTNPSTRCTQGYGCTKYVIL